MKNNIFATLLPVAIIGGIIYAFDEKIRTKVNNFCKNHKKEIAIVGGAIVGSAVICKISDDAKEYLIEKSRTPEYYAEQTKQVQIAMDTMQKMQTETLESTKMADIREKEFLEKMPDSYWNYRTNEAQARLEKDTQETIAKENTKKVQLAGLAASSIANTIASSLKPANNDKKGDTDGDADTNESTN